MLNKILVTTALLISSAIAVPAQSVAARGNDSADARAIETVHHAIATMGGASWDTATAATAQLAVSYPDPKLRSSTSTLSDDWHSGSARRRNESQIDKQHIAAAVQANNAYTVTDKAGKLKIYPGNYDLVTLAQTYPAAALSLALKRTECKFTVVPAGKEYSSSVEQDCRVSRYPQGNIQFIWWFDSTGLPARLQYPMLSADGKFVSIRTAIFKSYQQVKGVQIPQAVDLQFNGKLQQTLTFSNVSFAANLDDSKFSLQSNQ